MEPKQRYKMVDGVMMDLSLSAETQWVSLHEHCHILAASAYDSET